MKPILVPCVDGGQEEINYVCACSGGKVYVAYHDKIMVLTMDAEGRSPVPTLFAAGREGEARSSVGKGGKRRKTNGNDGERMRGIRMLAERSDGVLLLTDMDGIKLVHDGKIDMVLAHRGRFPEDRIKFCGDTLLFFQSMSANGSAGGQDHLVPFMGEVVVKNGLRMRAFFVDGERIDAANLRWPKGELVVSATVLGGNVYQLGEGSTLYKNGEPLLRLGPGARQLTSHPSSGLFVVQGDTLSRVWLDPKWTRATHRLFDAKVKKAVGAVMMLRKRGSKLSLLPLGSLHEVFDWLIR